MKIPFLSVFLLIAIAAYAGGPQDVHFQLTDDQMNGQLGVIAVGDEKVIGSGFAFGDSKEVVTCDHVVAAAVAINQMTNLTFISGKQICALHLKYRLPKFDLAVLSPAPSLPGKSIPVGDFKKIRPGDYIVYMGYDQQASTNGPLTLIHSAAVQATGSAMNEGRVVDFLEFEGQGRPGYSGGAVMNGKGELVAVMREAWTKQGVKGGPPILINRAYSLEVLTLEGEVYSSSENSTNATATLTDLINLSSPVTVTNSPSK
jgi:S1-C subfamily serine protease